MRLTVVRKEAAIDHMPSGVPLPLAEFCHRFQQFRPRLRVNTFAAQHAADRVPIHARLPREFFYRYRFQFPFKHLNDGTLITQWNVRFTTLGRPIFQRFDI